MNTYSVDRNGMLVGGPLPIQFPITIERLGRTRFIEHRGSLRAFYKQRHVDDFDTLESMYNYVDSVLSPPILRKKPRREKKGQKISINSQGVIESETLTILRFPIEVTILNKEPVEVDNFETLISLMTKYCSKGFFDKNEIKQYVKSVFGPPMTVSDVAPRKRADEFFLADYLHLSEIY